MAPPATIVRSAAAETQRCVTTKATGLRTPLIMPRKVSLLRARSTRGGEAHSYTLMTARPRAYGSRCRLRFCFFPSLVP
jgi:hypothetical protein